MTDNITDARIIQFNETRLVHFSDSGHVIKSTYGEGRFMFQSFHKRKNDYDELMITTMLSFMVADETRAVEWEPCHGPFQFWEKAEATDDPIKRHWHFDYIHDTSLRWSQLIVDRTNIKQYLFEGNIEIVFSILESEL